MDRDAYFSLYERILTENALETYLDRAEAFYLLTERLITVNAQFNLTAITDPEEILVRHVVDCLAAASYFPKGGRVLDVGCGAGFPSLPLAAARQDLTVTAMDSTAKKLGFVQETASLLGLTNVKTVCARAEEAALLPAYRAKFDAVTARAVSRLNVLAELCLPFLRVGGLFLALKGENGEAEAAEAASGIRQLGGADGVCLPLPVRHGEEILHHTLYRTEKCRPTPDNYPRNYARICKKPL